MRTIEISDVVWQAIAKQGNFGETEDDVLRRVFNIQSDSAESTTKSSNGSASNARPSHSKPRRSFATQRMSSYINQNKLYVSFVDGASQSWILPKQSDKPALRSVREKAVTFAKENGATIGQQNAVKKTLTDNGYHLTK